jgi:hypothetical protein
VVPVDVRRDTLRVPNSALRFKPDDADVLKTPGDQATQQAAGAAPQEPGAAAAGAGGPGSAGGGAAAGGPGGSGASGGMGRGAGGGGGAAGGRPGGGPGRKAGGGNRPAVLYLAVAGSNKLRPVKVITSITDGTYTAVRSKDLKAGDPVVVGLQTARAGTAASPAGASRGPRF